jgi:hypothetical protein
MVFDNRSEDKRVTYRAKTIGFTQRQVYCATFLLFRSKRLSLQPDLAIVS